MLYTAIMSVSLYSQPIEGVRRTPHPGPADPAKVEHGPCNVTHLETKVPRHNTTTDPSTNLPARFKCSVV